MKKFLSLVLALVMTMSLVTVSAGAKDFTDGSKIQYPEAVDVMSAVKVIDGYTDGAFKPSDTLTRGAAAKIICNLILGPTTAAALVADTAPYKDVPTNHTFAGYIAYCQKEGIISGYADGTFRPAASLTGYAFMKMLLGALGYDAEVEQYTGPNWSVNVAKRALNIGLADDLVGDFNGIKAVNREEACLYALNTMTANMVEYDSKTSVTAGNTTVVVSGTKAKDMETRTNKNDGNVFTADRVVQFAEKYFPDLSVQKGADEFERPANVWKNKAEEIGTYADKPDVTYTKKVEAGDIYKDLGLSRTIAQNAVKFFVNGEESNTGKVELKKGSDAKIGANVYNTSNKIGSDGNGVLTEVFYNKDTEVVTITQIVTYIGEINKTVKATDKKDAYVVIEGKSSDNNKFSTTPVSVTGSRASALEFETNETIADETYVLYTYSFKTGDVGVQSVVPAQKVEGYVSKTINKVDNLDQNNGMTIAGTDYKMSKASAGEALGDISVKQDYTVYLDAYGYIIYVEEIQEIGNYALVLATANKGSFIGNKAQLLTTDGKIKFVNTDENYHSGSKKIDDNTIVTFRENTDGTYTLKTVKKDGKIATVSVDNDAKFTMISDKAGIVLNRETKEGTIFDAAALAASSTGATTTVPANSASVFVVADQNGYNSKFTEIDDWTSYTGIKNAPSVTNWNDATNLVIPNARVNAYYYCKNTMVTVMFVIPNKSAKVEDTSKNSVYFAAESRSDLEHHEEGSFFLYNAVVDGKLTQVKVAETITVTAADGTQTTKTGNSLAGLYKSYSTNNKGYVSGVRELPAYANTDAKSIVAGYGIDKTSKDYTVILDTYMGSNAPAGALRTGKATITVDENAKIYNVDKNGNITESSYSALYPDDNDRVFAVVQDYMVKVLMVEERKNDETTSSGSSLKKGEKPVAYFGGAANTDIIIPTVNGTAVDTAYNFLNSNGYTVTGVFGGMFYAEKNGVRYAFTSSVGSAYYTVSVNGKILEWVKSGDNTINTWEAVKKDQPGAGVKWAETTGSVTTASYKAYGSGVLESNVTRQIEISTGYVNVTATSVDTASATINGTNAPSTTAAYATSDSTSKTSVLQSGGTDGYLKYNELAVDVTYGKNGVAKNDGKVFEITVEVTTTEGVVKETQTVSNKALDAADVTLTFKKFGELKSAVSKIEVKAKEQPTTVTLAKTLVGTANGLTLTWDLQDAVTVEATGGAKTTVKGSLKITGDLTTGHTGNTVITLADNTGATGIADIKWVAAEATAVGCSAAAAAALTIPDTFANTADGVTIHFEFTVAAGSTAPAIKATVS